MENESEKGLDCSEPLLAKFLITCWVIGLLIWMVFGVWQGHIFGIVFAIYALIASLLHSPDIRLYADGMELSHFGLKHFIEWKDITHLNDGEWFYKMRYRGTPFLIRLITLDNSLRLYKWRRNYRQAIEIIEDNVLG